MRVKSDAMYNVTVSLEVSDLVRGAGFGVHRTGNLLRLIQAIDAEVADEGFTEACLKYFQDEIAMMRANTATTED